MEDRLVCVNHCGKIVCRNGVLTCPICGRKIDFSVITPPFYYPYPFVDAHDHEQALSVVVKPTSGTWRDACQSDSDLHVGVTDTNGGVVSYHWQGVMRDTAHWKSVIVVYRVPQDMSVQCDYRWQKFISELLSDDAWRPEHYNEHAHNCLDFVLAFLTKLYREITQLYGNHCLDELSFLTKCRGVTMRKNFSDLFVASAMDGIRKYLTLSDKVEKNGYACVP